MQQAHTQPQQVGARTPAGPTRPPAPTPTPSWAIPRHGPPLSAAAVETLDRIGRGYALQVLANSKACGYLRPVQWMRGKTEYKTRIPVPSAIVRELLASGLLSALTPNTKNYRCGTRELGLTGKGVYYACVQ